MVIQIEDLEEKNWLICLFCNNICKNPNYDFDLNIDECCLCSHSYVLCSTCYKKKKLGKSNIQIRNNL